MAVEVAFLKRAKISQAQKYMLLAVFGATAVLGASAAIVIHSVNQISYNANVIAEEEKAIVTYSDAIKTIGVCPKPSGTIYSDEELNRCNPDNVSASRVPNTLRSNILTNMAANTSLNSVAKSLTGACVNPKTGKTYTYDELEENYNDAVTATEIATASDLIESCSALRVIPDALPAFKNEEALLASINKIFLDSGWYPESLSPTGDVTVADFGTNLNLMSLRLSVEAGTGTTRNVLSNIERSIRELNINRATIEWASSTTLVIQAQASAYYMDESTLDETNKTIKPGGT